MELAAQAAMVVVATVTAVVAAKRSEKGGADGGHLAGGEAQPMSMAGVIAFPFAASLVLVTLYLFFNQLQLLLLAYIVTVSVVSLAFCLHPLLAVWQLSRWRVLRALSSVVVSCVLVALWVLTGHWVLNNILGIAICIAMVSVLRLPSLKVAAACLLGLLLYDVYWVFLSHLHFNESVMVAVAKQAASNPVRDAIDALPGADQLPEAVKPARRLELPNKLLFPVWAQVELEDFLPADAVASAPLTRNSLTSAHAAPPGGESDTSAAEEGDGATPTAPEGAGLRGGPNAGGANQPAHGRSAAAQDGQPQRPDGETPGPRRLRDASGASSGSGASGQRPQRRPQRSRGRTYTVWAIVGFLMLGLGDIALPGLLIAFALRVDAARAAADAAAAAAAKAAGKSGATAEEAVSPGGTAESAEAAALVMRDAAGGDASSAEPETATPASCCGLLCAGLRETWAVVATPGYFRTAVIGYAVGLCFTLWVSRTFQTAQPALLYLVPATLLPLLARGWRAGRGDLAALWHGKAFAQPGRDTAD